MKSKEALENIKDNYPLFHPTNYKLVKESYDTLDELVNRDTPLKVKKSANPTLNIAFCPKCRHILAFCYNGCPYCLQRLDWGE